MAVSEASATAPVSRNSRADENDELSSVCSTNCTVAEPPEVTVAYTNNDTNPATSHLVAPADAGAQNDRCPGFRLSPE